MAQQPESGRNASGIARAGKRKWGYNPEQVDEFLERTHALYDSEDAQLTQQDIQNVSFDLSKGGYVISQVDAALGRLERAVVDQQTTREIARHGRVVWKAQTEDLYRSLAAHADRAARQRFRPGDAKAPSYDRKQVDRLVDQVIESMEGEIPQAMYDARMDEMVNDFAFRVEQQGLRLEDYLKYMGQTMEQFRASFMPQAEKQVKIRLALEAVAAAENIEASEEEVSAEIKRIADQYKMEEDKVRELVNVDDLKKDLAINKAIDFIKSHANIVEKAAEEEKAADAE